LLVSVLKRASEHVRNGWKSRLDDVLDKVVVDSEAVVRDDVA